MHNAMCILSVQNVSYPDPVYLSRMIRVLGLLITPSSSSSDHWNKKLLPGDNGAATPTITHTPRHLATSLDSPHCTFNDQPGGGNTTHAVIEYLISTF